MGEPVKIVDLARNLIRLSGKSEDEIKIEFSGIRPGEKLYEELLNEDEIHPEQVYEKIYRGKVSRANKTEVNSFVNKQLTKFSKEELIKYANK